jgi:hypothetical protein
MSRFDLIWALPVFRGEIARTKLKGANSADRSVLIEIVPT